MVLDELAVLEELVVFLGGIFEKVKLQKKKYEKIIESMMNFFSANIKKKNS